MGWGDLYPPYLRDEVLEITKSFNTKIEKLLLKACPEAEEIKGQKNRSILT